jgi:hypothetical protein
MIIVYDYDDGYSFKKQQSQEMQNIKSIVKSSYINVKKYQKI